MTHTKAGKRSLFAALAAAALLAACHNHDDNDHASMTPPAGSSPPPAATDSFFSYVSQVLGTTSDTTEPPSTEGVAVTTPEDTEPQPLPVP